MIERGLRAGAAVAGALALLGLTVSVWPLGVGGYVSEAGVAGTGHAGLYQLSVAAIGLGAAMLAAGWWRPLRLAALVLAVAAPAIATSAVIPCTAGCPLPPYEPTTAQDLAHAAASLIGVACCALAMLVVAWQAADPARRLSRVAVAFAWPPLVATGLCIAAVGRGEVTGVLERLALTFCLLWMIAIGVVTAGASRPVAR